MQEVDLKNKTVDNAAIFHGLSFYGYKTTIAILSLCEFLPVQYFAAGRPKLVITSFLYRCLDLKLQVQSLFSVGSDEWVK